MDDDDKSAVATQNILFRPRILNIMLAACIPNLAVVACSTAGVLNRIFCVATADLSSSSMSLCYCSGGKPDVTDYVVTAKVANITCKEMDNPAV